MYTISITTQFKKDFKTIKKRGYPIDKLEKLLTFLMKGDLLPKKYKEHILKGNFKDHFDCHIEPDWLLIYKRDIVEKVIILIRTGTHSDIF